MFYNTWCLNLAIFPVELFPSLDLFESVQLKIDSFALFSKRMWFDYFPSLSRFQETLKKEDIIGEKLCISMYHLIMSRPTTEIFLRLYCNIYFEWNVCDNHSWDKRCCFQKTGKRESRLTQTKVVLVTMSARNFFHSCQNEHIVPQWKWEKYIKSLNFGTIMMNCSWTKMINDPKSY